MTDKVTVDIWSDIACPFCYIGKKKFEAAVAQSGIPVTVTYRSFELGPNTPEDVAESHAYLLALKMGVSPDEAKAMEHQITQAAEASGLEFRYDQLKPANTRKAHQLLHFAKAADKQVEMAERLLAAHFTEGRHVGQIAELVSLGAEVGLDPDEVTRVLESGEFLSEVDADIAQAASLGIRGVPFFVLNGKYGVNGAQEPEQFVAALQQAQQDQ
ncbi:DsbA family oxidoreductase [Jonesiaceae bacterium BS-20]|uniref:DsbA family oxidoreductase n=1 Tax=Jonesiaceae bacterium BS-20 TaxID=3120821 RepID=A0AAU7DWP4_9MICO